MQSGDERQAVSAAAIMAGEQGADGVGNGVMDVQDVQGLGLEDFKHLHCEGKGIGRVIEQGIGDYRRLMEMNAGVGQIMQ